ncbi:MAG: efflux RND transporter periplasmic adaptor subunit [Hyphomicrobiaceae bacterium]|nr:efflux RND transporter periplasmic adaptor subunit [Hyphomicrobiaceae bacterium]MCC0007258.1 efflux RND transporter periplasmic adaptor subunit [Hyphomicrobiaceae bacterium]
MAKIDSTIATIAVAFVAAAAVSAMLTWQPNARAPGDAIETGSTGKPATSQSATASRPRPEWAASATGRIEPKGGQVQINAAAPGEIAAVLVDGNDRVQEGDLLVRLDDTDQLSRIAAAEAETEVRRRERDDESKATGLALDRRKVADATEEADRALFKARQDLDGRLAALRVGGDTTILVNLRQAVKDAEKAVEDKRAELATVNGKEGMPLPDRLEAALTQARSDLRLAYQALERTRVRAPSGGTVLRVDAKVGELAGPSSPLPLVTFGDLTQMKVRAEVEERDIGKVRLGQRVIVRSDAFADKDFTGRVTAIATALGAPNIVTRGPRRPNDVDVLEVVATLDDASELVTGMRVDVFFAHPETAEAKE